MTSSRTHPSPQRPSKNPQAPGTSPRQVGPPFGGRTPLPGVSDTSRIRRTAQTRNELSPKVIDGGQETVGKGFPVTHPYVRRYWVAAIGPGAVADLLRLAAAAQSGRSLRTPTHLPTLLREGLVAREGGDVSVASLIPPLPKSLVARLTPQLRGELLAKTRRRQTA